LHDGVDASPKHCKLLLLMVVTAIFFSGCSRGHARKTVDRLRYDAGAGGFGTLQNFCFWDTCKNDGPPAA